ncbi:hypothetical protein ACB092_06G007100 [Castanea dentata]
MRYCALMIVLFSITVLMIFILASISAKIIFILLQLPISILVGWILGLPMDLNFQLFKTAMPFMTVLAVAFMLQVCI